MSEIPLSQPDITAMEIEAVVDVMKSGRLSIGPRQARFEEMVAESSGRRHGIAVNSGTSGLHLALEALEIGPGDEVITTPFSFIASANCILFVGATPVFVDIDPRSLNMDPNKVEAAITPQTKAIIGVEVFGNPMHMAQLETIAQKHNLLLIEDCCEGLGGHYQNRRVGGYGHVGVFGFYPNKQITTGEGGMIVTDDHQVAERCRSLRNQGREDMSNIADSNYANRSGAWLAHTRLGYNYRLSEIACGLGIAQMERLPEMLAARRRVAGSYIRRLMSDEGLHDLILPTIDDELCETMSWFVFVVRLPQSYQRDERDRIIEGMRRHEIGASNYFPCIHMQPFYRERFGFDQGMFPIAESISDRTIALPFFNTLDDPQIDLICQTLKVMIDRERLLRSA